MIVFFTAASVLSYFNILYVTLMTFFFCGLQIWTKASSFEVACRSDHTDVLQLTADSHKHAVHRVTNTYMRPRVHEAIFGIRMKIIQNTRCCSYVYTCSNVWFCIELFIPYYKVVIKFDQGGPNFNSLFKFN
jgi:hypothetical protein